MPADPQHVAVPTDLQDDRLDVTDSIEEGAAALVDVVWGLAPGETCAAETAWKSVHARVRGGDGEGWTEKAVGKSLEIAQAARAVSLAEQEPTIASVKAYLLAQGNTTGDYRKFSTVVAKAKARHVNAKKAEPLHVPVFEYPKQPPGGHDRDTRQAESPMLEPTGGLISFDLSEKMQALQLQRFTEEKDAALQDRAASYAIASRAMETTIATLSTQVASSQRYNLLLTIAVVALTGVAAIAVFAATHASAVPTSSTVTQAQQAVPANPTPALAAPTPDTPVLITPASSTATSTALPVTPPTTPPATPPESMQHVTTPDPAAPTVP